MMTVTYDELIRQVDTLDVEQQLRLATYLLERARQEVAQKKTNYRWSDICGRYPYPMLGEDAQAWVTRTRRESDEQRARSWEHTE
jgi:hypothetical protein